MFSSVFMGFGVFLNFRLKGGGAKNFQRVAKGEGIFNASQRGGRKIFNVSRRGGEKFSTFDFLESLGKIKGHVNKFRSYKDFRRMSPPPINWCCHFDLFLVLLIFSTFSMLDNLQYFSPFCPL